MKKLKMKPLYQKQEQQKLFQLYKINQKLFQLKRIPFSQIHFKLKHNMKKKDILED